MVRPHVLAIPYPAQGHVIPLMELSFCLVENGIRVTFVNTEFNHKRVMKAMSGKDNVHDLLHLVSIPDGLELWEDRNDLGKLSEAIVEVMPGKLQELIEKINESGNDDITCVIADESLGWALEVAKTMGIRRAAFWPASAAMLALGFSVQKLIDDGTINHNGTPMKNQMIQLSPTMPSINTANLAWACIDWVICNSTYDLESAAFSLVPNISPIGPLLASKRLGMSAGYFWPEDSTCLKWLDQQPEHSVIYVAFGSFTVFDKNQFQELALGLELTNRPFLWVVRPDITREANDAYPKEFIERVGTRGRMVGWAPQQNVLDHPSIACFVSHCGWNSTMEGVSNGVPFLCWPYFADQYLNQNYICDIWKIGLGFNRDESDIISHQEIKNKVEQLLGDKAFKERAMALKEKAMSDIKEGGCSHKNINNFVQWLKEK